MIQPVISINIGEIREKVAGIEPRTPCMLSYTLSPVRHLTVSFKTDSKCNENFMIRGLLPLGIKFPLEILALCLDFIKYVVHKVDPPLIPHWPKTFQ